MKRFYFLLSTLLFSVLWGNSAFAYDVEVDGIYYNFVKANVAEVTSGDNKYIGEITIPSSITYKNVQYSVNSIGKKAFYDCNGLTAITIPNTVNEISYRAFAACYALTNVTFGNSLKTICQYAFAGCKSIERINIPNTVTNIENNAFEYCENLSSITLPNSLTNITESSFQDCKNLTTITIPNSVKSIDKAAFAYCTKLTSVNIPNSVTSIGALSFAGCALSSLTIPYSVTEIGIGAFDGCSLTTITIPSSVKVFDYAFRYCKKLISATINCSSIGKNSFEGCEKLQSVAIGENVKTIGEEAFADCINLTSISIPNSVETIEAYAFRGCKNITSISLGNSLTKMECDFVDCRELNTVNITDIGSWCNIDFGYNAFVYPYNLYVNGKIVESLIIPDTVKSIKKHSFAQCISIKKVTIPTSVKSIGERAFNGCTSILSLNIPNSVTNIGSYCFADCSNISDLFLGNSVSSIGSSFVSYCNNLKDIYCTALKIPESQSDPFGGLETNEVTLHVPETSLAEYRRTNYWNHFGAYKAIEGNIDEVKQCAVPIISYQEGMLKFTSETDGAQCYYTLNAPDVITEEAAADGNNVLLSAYYDITCYAKADGYTKSETSKAKLYWLASSGSIEGDHIETVSQRGIVIQSSGGFIGISGLNNNECVSFYSIDGKTLGSAKAMDGALSFAAKPGAIVIAKIGNESIKVYVE